jgi:hypothetical protein
MAGEACWSAQEMSARERLVVCVAGKVGAAGREVVRHKVRGMGALLGCALPRRVDAC